MRCAEMTSAAQRSTRLCVRAFAVATALTVCCVLWGPRPGLAQQQEDLRVLHRWVEWSHAETSLQRHLNRQAFELLDARQERIEALQTADDWRRRQEEVRTTLERIVGPFPEKTPLNPQVLGAVEKDGYRVEHIVFESMPGFYVTACLFLPEERQEKAPAILNVIGHTDIAFRAAGYQNVVLNLVDKGFIVLAMDPVGQGERKQYYDPELGRSVVGGATAEHSYFGIQAFLAGCSAARYFVWDGIRAIDYLVSRPEVDPERIGVTGLSGGGTQTSYIAALDERVLAASPACYITGFRRLLESIGPQDAEQNFNGGLVEGIDHADFLEVRAPRPTLVVATTRDFFSIQGTREVLAEAEGAFAALGAAENLQLVEDDHGHGFTRRNNEATYAFFQEHLNLPGDATEREIDSLSVEELTVTPTGQLIDSLGGETVFSLNREVSEPLLERLDDRRRQLDDHLPQVEAEARRISGYRPPQGPAGLVYRGRYQRDGYTLEMHVMQGEGEIVLPFLLAVPDEGTKHPALIYLHPEGKSAAAAPGGEIEWLVRQGYAVLAMDLSGMGELGQTGNAEAFLGVLIGRSIAGIRAADVVRGVQYLRSREDIDPAGIAAVARGSMAVPLLHAAAFEESIDRIALIEPLISYRAVVMNRFYEVPVADVVFNALTAYDLPDLAATLAPRTLMVVNVQDEVRQRVQEEQVDEELAVVRSAYAAAQDRLLIRALDDVDDREVVFADWLASPAGAPIEEDDR